MSKKTILITGTSSGIGRASALLFQSKGWNVIATMRTPQKETELQKLENVLVSKLDVMDLNSIQTSIAEGIAKFGQIDVLLNNAGASNYGALESLPRTTIVNQFNTNVIGLMDVSRAILPHFRKNKKGILINVSSSAGLIGFPFGSLYCGTKFAVEGISEALSYEVASFGGKVKLIEPGMINTGIADNNDFFTNDETLTEYQPAIKATVNLFSTILSTASPVSSAANVIYEAATDGTDQLRYTVGEDAAGLVSARKQADDATFMSGLKAQFGF